MKRILTFLLIVFSAFSHSATYKSIGVGGGGAFYCPSINPYNSNEIFVPSDMSNMFRTTDMGGTWEMYHFQKLRALNISKVCFTSDPKIMFTIHNDFGADLFVPVKSTDGGNSWSQLPNEPTEGNTFGIFTDESSTNRLILASYDQIYFSKDGGNSFSAIYEGDPLTFGAYVAGVFWDGQKIIIGLANGILESTDGGTTFNFTETFFTTEEYCMSFVGTKKSGNAITFYCLTVDNVWPGIQGWDYPTYMGFYSMDYSSSKTWSEKTPTLPANSNPFFLSMAKNNSNVIYMAGYNTNTSTPSVLKSSNAGSTFNEVFNTSGNKNISTAWQGTGGDRDWTYGEIALGFSCSSTNALIAAITDYGFIHITTDGGTSWKQVYSDKSGTHSAGSINNSKKPYKSNGLENTTCWTLSFDENYYSSKIFAGFTDIRGIISSDGGDEWSFNYNGHTDNTMYQIVVTGKDKLFAATSTVHDLYQSTYLTDLRIDAGGGKVIYSSDGGTNWQLVKDFKHPVVYLASGNDGKSMYASVVHSTDGGIYYCEDATKLGSSVWTKLTNPPRTQGHPYNIKIGKDNSILCSYSGRRDAAGKFTASSGVFLSNDNGKTWTDISDINMYYWTKDILIDKNNPNTFYACVFSGWGGAPNGLGGLYKTTNRGTSWTKIFDSDRVESVSQHPRFDNRLYVTTEFDGLWVSNDINGANPTFNQVEDYPFQHPLRVFFMEPISIPEEYRLEMWVTSFGNGIRTTLETKVGVDENIANNEISIYPNPATEKVSILNNYSNEISKIEAFNTLGEKLFDSGMISISNGNTFIINLVGNGYSIKDNNFVIFKIFTGNNIHYKKLIVK